MYKFGDNRKCTGWSESELEQSTVTTTLYTLNIYPWGPNFGPVYSTISCFWDTTNTRSAKIGNASNDPRPILKIQQLKVLYMYQILTQEALILVLFALRLAVSEIQHVQGQRKSETEWPQTELEHLTVKSTLYILHIPPRPKFWSVSLYDYPFLRYNVVKNRKWTEWPNTEIEKITVKTTLYTLSSYPWGPNFHSFHSTTSGFQDIAHFTIPHWLPC